MEPRPKRQLKLSVEQVAQLRAFAETGLYSIRSIAEFYGISYAYANRIINNKMRVAGQPDRRLVGNRPKNGLNRHKRKISDEQVEELRRLSETGKYSVQSLAEYFKISVTHTYSIIHYRVR